MPQPRSKLSLAGRPVVITGAASGIGRAIARRLAQLGSPLALADIDEAGLKQTAASLPGTPGTPGTAGTAGTAGTSHLTSTLDVADATAVQAFARDVRHWLPGNQNLAAVFNNAGVAVAATVRNAVPEDDEWLHRINFGGVLNGTRAFLPILIDQDFGAIVNTSSVFGLVGMPTQSAYCASKFAIRGYTDSLRQELRGTNVRAVTVHPGGVTTNIARNARVRSDPEGRGRTREQLAEEFERITMTSPEKAAAIIIRGVERGKARILVGPDAYLFDALARIAPTHYYDVLARLETGLRRRQQRRTP